MDKATPSGVALLTNKSPVAPGTIQYPKWALYERYDQNVEATEVGRIKSAFQLADL
jgi:hypothetical protein